MGEQATWQKTAKALKAYATTAISLVTNREIAQRSLRVATVDQPSTLPETVIVRKARTQDHLEGIEEVSRQEEVDATNVDKKDIWLENVLKVGQPHQQATLELVTTVVKLGICQKTALRVEKKGLEQVERKDVTNVKGLDIYLEIAQTKTSLKCLFRDLRFMIC